MPSGSRRQAEMDVSVAAGPALGSILAARAAPDFGSGKAGVARVKARTKRHCAGLLGLAPLLQQARQFDCGLDAHLVENVRAVDFYRAHTDAELVGDDLVHLAVKNKIEHFPLAQR
jgi:hypothetical protein